MTKIVTITRTRIEDGSSDFGLVDDKGRALGYSWSIIAAKVEPTAAMYGYVLADDHPDAFFWVDGTTTRDGKRYGASQRDVKAFTIEEARLIAAKRVCTARNAYTKKFGKVPA